MVYQELTINFIVYIKYLIHAFSIRCSFVIQRVPSKNICLCENENIQQTTLSKGYGFIILQWFLGIRSSYLTTVYLSVIVVRVSIPQLTFVYVLRCSPAHIIVPKIVSLTTSHSFSMECFRNLGKHVYGPLYELETPNGLKRCLLRNWQSYINNWWINRC